ncbi:hypothetical protein DFH27DRAFT_606294 [Peziza echinospora]|nr:hypothetical protein DFH27DRAFT_606294 [Peziza echinospora]
MLPLASLSLSRLLCCWASRRACRRRKSLRCSPGQPYGFSVTGLALAGADNGSVPLRTSSSSSSSSSSPCSPSLFPISELDLGRGPSVRGSSRWRGTISIYPARHPDSGGGKRATSTASVLPDCFLRRGNRPPAFQTRSFRPAVGQPDRSVTHPPSPSSNTPARPPTPTIHHGPPPQYSPLYPHIATPRHPTQGDTDSCEPVPRRGACRPAPPAAARRPPRSPPLGACRTPPPPPHPLVVAGFLPNSTYMRNLDYDLLRSTSPPNTRVATPTTTHSNASAMSQRPPGSPPPSAQLTQTAAAGSSSSSSQTPGDPATTSPMGNNSTRHLSRTPSVSSVASSSAATTGPKISPAPTTVKRRHYWNYFQPAEAEMDPSNSNSANPAQTFIPTDELVDAASGDHSGYGLNQDAMPPPPPAPPVRYTRTGQIIPEGKVMMVNGGCVGEGDWKRSKKINLPVVKTPNGAIQSMFEPLHHVLTHQGSVPQIKLFWTSALHTISNPIQMEMPEKTELHF